MIWYIIVQRLIQNPVKYLRRSLFWENSLRVQFVSLLNKIAYKEINNFYCKTQETLVNSIL